MKAVKIISIMLAVIMVANITFFALARLSTLMFWLVIIFCALMAYFGIPYLKKKRQIYPKI